MRAPILTTVLPHERHSGGEIVTQEIADALGRAGFSVPVVGYSRPGAAEAGPRQAHRVGTRPIETDRAGLRALVWMGASLLRGIPYSVAKYRSRAYLGVARRALIEPPGLVVAIPAQTWFAVPEVERCGAPLVYVAHNVEADVYRRLAEAATGRVKRWAYRREARLVDVAERDLVRKADQVWALTEDDAARLGALGSRREVRTLAAPSRLEPVEPGPAGCDVALLGSWTWQANAHGLEWFSREVVPLLPPGMTVRVAGAGADWLRGRHPRVEVLGRVPDAREFLSTARVLAVPSTEGGGVQVKVLDAVATGLPVVATRVATRGLSGLPGSVKVAESAEEFALVLRESVAIAPAARVCPEAVEWSRARARQFDTDVGAWASELAGGTTSGEETQVRATRSATRSR